MSRHAKCRQSQAPRFRDQLLRATDAESIVERASEGDDGSGNFSSLLDFPTPRHLDFTLPLLPLDPPFQDIVQVAGADDLSIAGVEDGRVEEKRLSLRAAEPAVVADELFERRHLTGHGVDGADHQNIRHIHKLRLTPEMPRRIRPELNERVLAIDHPIAQEVDTCLADR
jgi:hypothetical protein